MRARPAAAKTLWTRPDVEEYVAEMTTSGSFVHQMATGTLPRDKYLRFLSQDAYFLFHFNRAYAQALRLATSVDEQRVFHKLIGGVLDELRLHAAACDKWGVDLSNVEVHAASRAYVEFLESLHGKSLLELLAGMIPCMRLYAYIGRYFLTQGDAGVADVPDPRTSPYAEWFEAYGGDEMESLACHLESLLPQEITDEAAIDNYVAAIRLERDFFAAHA
jgi:thiaminase/transcriptional activator TenA